jgi:peptidoglycan/LPS O-acetylase OafA/YrhL
MSENFPSSSVTSSLSSPERSMGGVYQPQIDGLRALAVTGVLLHHFGMHIPDSLEYGPMSVRLFFALTGYFITMWLWRAEDAARAGGVSVWRELPVFHARRLLRIVPPLYLSLAVAVLFGLDIITRDLHWHALFASNFYAVHVGYWPPMVAHLWSLAVQEQFYLLWPMVILFTPRRWFLGVLVLSVLIAVAFRFYCVTAGVDPLIRWTMLPGSIDSFAIGGFVAWLGQGKIGTAIMTTPQRWGFGVLAFGCLLVARALRYLPQDSLWVPTIELWEGVFIGWLIAATSQGWRGPLGWFLSLPPLVYIGKISLGIYLFHVLVEVLIGPRLVAAGLDPVHANALRIWTLWFISIGVAAVSWHFFEKPLSKLKPAMVGRFNNRR